MKPTTFRRAVSALLVNKTAAAHRLLRKCGTLTASQQRIWDRVKLRTA